MGDDYQGGYLATKHLLLQGCRRIAHISGPLTCSIYRDRYAGYQVALSESGIPLDEELVLFRELNQENALDSCESLFSLPEIPDVIFAGNDTTAIGIIQYAKHHGLQIPSKLKIIGCSNDPRAEIIEPAISSVEQFPYEMGKQAAKLTIDLITGKAEPGRNMISLTTPIELVKRTSSSHELNH